MKQQEHIQNLLKLIKENPDLKIVPMVDSEIVGGDDFGWWMGSWGSAEVDELYVGDDRVYFRSTDEERLVDDLADNADLDNGLTDDENISKAEREVADYEWKKVIAVRINLP